MVGKLAGGLATFGLAAQGVGAITSAVGGLVGAALEGEAATAQTEAVIKSTGGAAGVTAEQVAKLADSFELSTKFSAEAVQAGENMLLTFTNIGSQTFPRATETILDMSQALGQDLNSSAVQLGKALNDPIAGVSALSRVGVTFTEQQKEQIKAMAEAGDVAGAQALILDELQKEFGGSAEAAGKTFGGQLAILKNRLGNVQETIGQALIPVLTRLAERALPLVERGVAALSEFLPVVIGYVSRFAEQLRGPLQSAFVLVRDCIMTFVQALSGNWSDDERIRPLHRIIGNLGVIIREVVIPAVQDIAAFFTGTLWPAIQQGVEFVGSLISAFQEGGLSGVFRQFVDGIGEIMPELLAKLGELLIMVGDWVVNTGIPFLAEQLAQWADAFGAWAQAAIPPMLERLGELLGVLGNWLADEGLPLLFDKLGQWGQALVDWIGPRIVPVLTALGELLLAVGTWIGTVAAPAIGGKLAEWGAQFIDWIKPQIVPMLAALGGLLLDLGDWLIDTALPAIGAKLAEWGGAFIAWVAPQIPPLLAELGRLLFSLGDWLITTALPEIGAKLGEWAWAFISWVGPQIPPLLLELGKLYLALEMWILTEALPKIISKLTQWAGEFVAWVGPAIPPLLLELAKVIGAIEYWIIFTALPAIVTKLERWGEEFLGWVADVVPQLPGKLLEIQQAISQWVTDTAGDIAAEGLRVASNFVDGLISMLTSSETYTSLYNAAWDLTKGMLQGAWDAINPGSPSREGQAISTNLVEGMIAGLQAMTDAIIAVIREMTESLIQAIKGAEPDVAEAGAGAGVAVVEGTTEGMAHGAGAAPKATPGQSGEKVGGDYGQGLARGARATEPDVREGARPVGSAAVDGTTEGMREGARARGVPTNANDPEGVGYDVGSDYGSGVARGVRDQSPAITGSLPRGPEPLPPPPNNPWWEWGWDAGESVAEGVEAGIEANFDPMGWWNGEYTLPDGSTGNWFTGELTPPPGGGDAGGEAEPEFALTTLPDTGGPVGVLHGGIRAPAGTPADELRRMAKEQRERLEAEVEALRSQQSPFASIGSQSNAGGDWLQQLHDSIVRAVEAGTQRALQGTI